MSWPTAPGRTALMTCAAWAPPRPGHQVCLELTSTTTLTATPNLNPLLDLNKTVCSTRLTLQPCCIVCYVFHVKGKWFTQKTYTQKQERLLHLLVHPAGVEFSHCLPAVGSVAQCHVLQSSH